MESRNEIKKRMIANAARAWGLSNREMEGIDPLIPLLFDACAAELERMGVAIDEAGQRIALKMMELLTPESMLNPAPARSVLHALPFDPVSTVDEDVEFYYFKRNPFQDEDVDLEIYFTPVAEHKLYNARVECLATGGAIYRLDEINEKNIIVRSRGGKGMPDCLWIGLSLNKPIGSLQGASFFFDIDEADDRQEKVFYQALKQSKWEITGVPVAAVPGYGAAAETKIRQNISLPLTDFNKARNVSGHVLDFYRKKFVTLEERDWGALSDPGALQRFPAEFLEVFAEEDLKPLTGKLLWIRVNFHPHIPAGLTDKVRCSINCFPVINRRMEKFFITGYERIRELAMKPHEVFFDLHEVTAEEELEVVVGAELPLDMEGKVALTLRKDNIGRFNEANAVEKIHQMVDAYRGEYAAFSRIKGLDHDHVTRLVEAVRPFEVAVDQNREYLTGTRPYVMLRTEDGKENAEVLVRYYLSMGSLANGISKGLHLSFDSSELMKDKIFLMDATFGGTDRLGDEDLIRSFHYALLTQGRIVTMEDVRALSEVHFGKYAQSIDVRKGVGVDERYGSGLQRVIEIEVALNPGSGLSQAEIKYMKDDLEQQLMERSTNVMPFKIVVEAMQ